MTRFTRLALAFLTMVAGVFVTVTAVSAPSGASPYGHPFICHQKTVVKANGNTIVVLRCSGDGVKYQCRLAPVAKPCKGTLPQAEFVLHSKPLVLGMAKPDANGVITATYKIPAGFIGNHTIEARLVTSNTAALTAAQLNAKTAAETTRVMMPITVGKASTVTRTVAVGAPVSSSDGWVKIAVVGVGALGIVMLFGGGLLLFAGRRRRVLA